MANDDPVVFDERSAKLVEFAVRRVRQNVRNPGGRPADIDRTKPGRWLPFINESAEEVPPYACMRVTGSTYDDDGGITILRCDKPSTDFTTEYVFNSNRTVPANSSADATDAQGGLCTYGPWAVVASDTTITLANGDKLGPKPGSWQVFRGYPTVASVAGSVDSSERWALARIRDISTLVGKTDASIAALATNTPGSGSVSIYALVSSTLTDTNQNVTAYNMTATAVSSGVFVQLKYIDGVPWVDVESCP